MQKKIISLFFILSLMANIYGEITLTNKTCPVHTDEHSEIDYKTTHKGSLVYFCCKKCLNKFKNKPVAYQANIVFENKHPNERPHFHNDHGHNHETDHDSNNKNMNQLIGKLHPILVHFPIAGIFFTFILQMTSFVYREKELYFAIRFLLLLSTISILLTGLSGWSNASSRVFTGNDVALIFWHQQLAIASNIMIFFTLLVSFKCKSKKGRWFGTYLLLLMLSLVLVSITGHFGGMLVYGSAYFNS
jgi:uncharacterized membrane protein/YHS domain-containing protein